MRYFIKDGAFFIRGAFTMLRAGVQREGKGEEGTLAHISTIIANHLPQSNTKEQNDLIFEALLRKNGYKEGAFTLPVTTPIDRFCIFAYDGIMIFILAALGRAEGAPGTVTTIIYSREPFSVPGLRTLQATAEEAVQKAFTTAGYPDGHSERNSVFMCFEGMQESPNLHERLSRAQTLISETIAYGIPEIWAVSETKLPRIPAFYIHSSINGDRWSRWNPDGCPYYPCHPSCAGQRCDFCYCPLYPCNDESLGKWLERENQGRIWSCEGCILVHVPAVADYLTAHPEATLEELTLLRKKGKENE